jgi:predicted Zn finger-like uncharacterized protein
MLIICPHCATSYQVEQSAVGQAGRSVRCMRCRTVWFAANTAALSEAAVAHRSDVAQFATTELEPDAPLSGSDAGHARTEPKDHAPFLAAPTAAASAAAEMRVLDDAPPIAEANPGDALAAPTSSELDEGAVTLEATANSDTGAEDIETVAARRARASAKARRRGLQLPGLPTVILTLAALDIGLIGWRTEIVRWAPQMAPLYAAIGLPVNVRGLVFADVTVETQSHEGVAVLVVQGSIVSAATRMVEVPRLRFAVRNADGNEIYKWTALPSRALLAPGETLAFQSRLASPPPETHDVLVRFFTRGDLRSGIE